MGQKKLRECRMMNVEVRKRSWKSEDGSRKKVSVSAPTGRNLIAQGAALCNECNADFIVPRSIVVQGDEFAWDKNSTLLADRNRLAHSEEAEKNRSLSSQYIKNGSIKSIKENNEYRMMNNEVKT